MSKQTTYQDAGVDVDAGNSFIEMIATRIAEAWPGGEDQIGGFAGGGPIPEGAIRVEGSADGPGTKILLAALMEMFDGIGQDVAAMTAVDLFMSGCRPTYMIDTFKAEVLHPHFHIKVIESLIRGCKLARCRLIGGETAELPGMFRYPWTIDLDATVIGFPDPDLTYVPVKPGQLVYGWISGGVGANGLSLARRVFRLDEKPSVARKRLQRRWPELGNKTLAEVLLEPTRIWIDEIDRQREGGVKYAGHAHITGGGLVENIPRILPPNLKVLIDRRRWSRPAIFSLIQKLGDVPQNGSGGMDQTFNQGIQVVSIVATEGATPSRNDICVLIGQVHERNDDDDPQVQFINDYDDEEL